MQRTAEPTAADLARELTAVAKFLLHASGRDFYREVGELDLSISQIRILHVLTRERHEASVKQLADEIGLSVPAASRSVDALVQRGLVTRTENSEDRRLKAVRATGQARALTEHLTELRLAGIADFVDSLSPGEQADLRAALEPITERIRNA